MSEIDPVVVAIVEFIRAEAVEFEPGGPFGKVVFACMMDVANKIERGELRATLEAGK